MSKSSWPTDLASDDIAGRLRFTTVVARRWCWLRDVPVTDHADAEQEAHLAVVKALPSYDDSRPLRPFLYTCIVRRLHSWQQKRRHWLRYQTDVRHVQSKRPRVRVSFDLDDLVNRLTLTEVAVTMLNDREQWLLARLLDGADAKDISRARGITHQCVYDKIRRLVRKLRDLLADEEDHSADAK
jgi:RNA polymerase sigma factor (sigma-70 family)